jgi:alkanesulfonate monooxygenase SsuD/methylene tetrahydromethanopterin reductase-like flavin-dependent oxidoreductase (luciferase family)
LKFGINVNVHFSPELSAPRAFEYAVRHVRAAREGGFDGIFAAHHYALGSGEALFQPFPLLARLAAEANGMTMGTSIFLLSLHNPLEAAELAATLDIITGGRFVFGVGQGYRDVEFASFGIPRSRRRGRLEEAVQVIRKLWAEDGVTWQGDHFPLQGVTINPKPVQQPGPAIWVGGDTLLGVRRAADIGDAWMTSPRHSKGFIRQALEVYKERRLSLGLSVPPPVFFREMYVARSREEAEREMVESFERLYQVYHREGQPGERYDRSFQELQEDRIIMGSPEDVRQEIQTYRDEFGAEYMFFRVYYLGMDPEKAVQCVRLFGEEVIPHFASTQAPSGFLD